MEIMKSRKQLKKKNNRKINETKTYLKEISKTDKPPATVIEVKRENSNPQCQEYKRVEHYRCYRYEKDNKEM